MIYPFSDIQLLALLAMVITLTASCVIDLQQKILPDYLTAIVAIIGVGLAFYAPIRITGWEMAAWGSVAGGVGSWLFREAAWRWRGVEAMGLGDVKLFAAIGIWVGVEGVVSAALAGSVLTILVVGLRWLWTRQGGLRDEVPFGPGIAAGFLITLLWGPVGPLVAEYLL